MEKKKILVLLAGCGAKDGAEIREAVLALTAIDREGADFQCTAPNIDQKHVLNFINDKEMPDKRNVMIEAARIARGDILDLAKVSMKDYDALVIPGGYGVAKNLCTFAFDGAKASVLPDVARIINEAYDQKKPIGAICIAPALVALVLAKKNPNIKLTLGLAEEPNMALKEIGVTPKTCLTTEFIMDKESRIISTPAYMDGKASLSELEAGISKCIAAVVELAYFPVAA
jgi:enhancing lycopene biosynthesis protein 2